jgi:hypothetical protein
VLRESFGETGASMNWNEPRQLASRKPTEYYERVIRKVV